MIMSIALAILFGAFPIFVIGMTQRINGEWL
jgi:hypothetical protein